MGQKKGKTGNPNGRPKGTPNKTTQLNREWITNLLNKNTKQIEKDLQALEPKDRLQMIEKFMNYTVPKMQNISTNITFDQMSESQLNSIINELTKDIEI